jgi:NAD(P)-dependent dehydrogenase (short-subunit alcohol dehydrogenase family)
MNIIVTGASRGIGRETVKGFVRHGNHKIIAVSRNNEKLSSLKLECGELNPGSEVVPVSVDIASEGFFEKFSLVIERLDNPIDVLINNAGGLVNKPFTKLTEEDFDFLFNVNVKSVFQLTRLLYPKFSKGAHIINIGSMGGYQGSSKFPGLSLYSASKGAVAILTESMAEEFKEDGISVNCLAIGAVQTEMLEGAFPGYKAPLSSDEMASFIVDFAFNGKKYFNGKILPVSVSTP